MHCKRLTNLQDLLWTTKTDMANPRRRTRNTESEPLLSTYILLQWQQLWVHARGRMTEPLEVTPREESYALVLGSYNVVRRYRHTA